MSIRLAVAEDVEQVAHIHVAAWQWAYRGHMPDAFLDGLKVEDRAAMWRNALAAVAPERRIWVTEQHGAVVAFAACGPVRDAAEPGVAEIYAVYQLPSVAGTGVGSALLQHAAADLAQRGFVRAVLWVLRDNTRAVRAYTRLGWAWDGGAKDETVGGVVLPHHRMALALAPRV